MKVGIDEYPMDLLGWKEITTERQKKNGTRIFQLPIKMYGKYIKVGSFKSGYVRRLECIGYRSDSSYQLNKRIESEPEYFDSGKKDSMDRPLYTQFTTRTCELINNEEDRLEYLITYCLKNYYIKQANMIEDGKFVPAWKYQDLMDRYEEMSLRFEEAAMELDNKEINKIGWRYGNEDEISVTINGHRYNVT
jgi:hypothetical protein